ncbi:MAG: phosphate ABC transporter permease PstA [Gammaproteobacteria bacterium]|nr:phosphate ABC transporter permease PstA [Gammaproteobacteria bacterium]
MATSDSVSQDLSLQRQSLLTWWRSGDPWIWLTSTAVAASVAAVLGLIGLLAVNGLAHFWPSQVLSIEYERFGTTTTIFGELSERESIGRYQFLEANPGYDRDLPTTVERWLIKTGNRQANPPDFRWLYAHDVIESSVPTSVVVIERTEWGDAFGHLVGIKAAGEPVEPGDLWEEFQARIERTASIREGIDELQEGSINGINYELESIRLEKRRRQLDAHHEFSDLEARESALRADYAVVENQVFDLTSELERDTASLALADGRVIDIPISTIIQAWMPNSMSIWQKLGLYFKNLWNFLTEDPREANTEGGVYPALFGTVLMVLLMSALVTPFGVIAALYLREYAKQGPLVQLIRIAVNNLAGVPSIVYGVFGLGFFVYLIGGTIDDLFFPEAKPAPTFGTPGLIWASLTLALLTVPVVIVSTEEGLTRIPREVREGSLALGATKAETIFKVVLPMASPSILTGMILAVARAAGEVAPLMLVGVVKLAPTLPIDGNFPYLHLERKFMHLGFHIYDVGFQSPNVDAARPLVFATALLLVLIIIVLNLTAITLRNRLEARYRVSVN